VVIMNLWTIAVQTFELFHQLENFPHLRYERIQNAQNTSFSPFDDVADEITRESFIVPCVYTENDELVVSNQNVLTRKQLFVFVKESDLKTHGIDEPSVSDTIVFPLSKDGQPFGYGLKPSRYTIKAVYYVFGLWRLKIDKID